MTVEVTQRDLSAAMLRRKTARSRDANAARRVLAIASVLDGRPREDAAVAYGMTGRRCATGCAVTKRMGPPSCRTAAPRLSAAQGAELDRWVEAGPEFERDGVVRCRDPRPRIEGEFGVRLRGRTAGKLLAKLRFRRLSVRPRHLKNNSIKQLLFEKASPSW